MEGDRRSWGLNGQSGNANTTNGDLGIGAPARAERQYSGGKGLRALPQPTGGRTASEQRVTGRHEKLLNKRSFWYEALDLKRDEWGQKMHTWGPSRDHEHPAASGGGREQLAPRPGVGAGVTHENASKAPASRTFPVGEVRENREALHAKVTLAGVTKLAFSLSDTSSFRHKTTRR